jgi:hypothetical protein
MDKYSFRCENIEEWNKAKKHFPTVNHTPNDYDFPFMIGWHKHFNHPVSGVDFNNYINTRPASTLLKQSTLQFIKKHLNEKETKDS